MSRIAYIAPSYLPSRRANTFQVMKMAGALTELGHDVRVLVPLPDGRHPAGPETRPVWPDLGDHYGLQVRFEIEWLAANRLWRGFDFGLSASRRAGDLKVDAVLGRHPQAVAAAGRRGIPTMLEVHHAPQGVLGPWLLRAFLASRGARRLVATSEAILADIRREFKLPAGPFAVVERNGVDLQRYEGLPDPEAARAMLGLPERFTAGYTGHLYAGRGMETILELARQHPPIQFLVVGGRAEDVDRVRAEAAELQNVVLTGFVPNARLPAYQAACDVLMLPYGEQVSDSSGGDIARYTSPLKLFEYLAAGRAVMSSDLPALREILNDRLAVLLPPGDLDAWSAALAALIADPERCRRLGAAGRETAAYHSWQARAKRILAGLG